MDDEREGALVKAPAAMVVAEALSAKAITRHYLASAHLWAAIKSAERCRALEEAHIGYGRGTHPTHRAAAISAITSAAAFLESLVNEYYQDAAEGAPGRVEALTTEVRAQVKAVWDEGEQGMRILEKYQRALEFADGNIIDPGRSTCQNASLVIALRNGLVHFKPAWHDDEAPVGLERRLFRKFPKSQLLRPNDGSPWPIWALGAGGAGWSIASVRTFADEWLDRMGLERQYEADLRSFADLVLADGE